MRLVYEHDQRPFGKGYRLYIFSCWLFRQTVKNQINFDRIIKTLGLKVDERRKATKRSQKFPLDEIRL